MSEQEKYASKEEIIDWCKQQVEEGKELMLKWEGGGDSGWVYFEIDGEQVDNEYTRTLVDCCYDELDYGSWAGEFSASGEAPYDAEKNAFVGTDYYSEDVTVDVKVDHKIVIPKKLWFDNLQISAESEEPSVVELAIKNGFLTPEHEECRSKIASDIDDMISKTMTDYENETGQETRGVWFDVTYPRSDFKEEGDNLVIEIDTYPIGTYSTVDKDIVLDLDSFLD